MKIRAFEVTRGIVRGTASRDGALVVLRDQDGVEGVGEAAPIGGWTGGEEPIEGVVRRLNAACTLIVEVDDGEVALSAIERALAGCREVLEGCPAAMFAIETALLDLVGQRRGVGVAKCLSDSAPQRDRSVSVPFPFPTSRSGGGRGARALPYADLAERAAALSCGAVETSALLIGPASGGAFVEQGLAALRRGFRALKVKLRAEEDEALGREIEGVAALRRAAPDFELRLDPNGRWSVPDARRRLERLAELRPLFVEQPVPAGALAELGPCAVPWAADESLAVPAVVEELSREGGCAAFVIKPAALGVGRALALASVARARGLPVVVTHFLDGPIGLAAACETALSLVQPGSETGQSLAGAEGPELLACGLDPHAGVRDLAPELLPHHREAGRIQPTGAAGLGLARGRALLAAYSILRTGMDAGEAEGEGR